jgi:hypothetical protein
LPIIAERACLSDYLPAPPVRGGGGGGGGDGDSAPPRPVAADVAAARFSLATGGAGGPDDAAKASLARLGGTDPLAELADADAALLWRWRGYAAALDARLLPLVLRRRGALDREPGARCTRPARSRRTGPRRQQRAAAPTPGWPRSGCSTSGTATPWCASSRSGPSTRRFSLATGTRAAAAPAVAGGPI